MYTVGYNVVIITVTMHSYCNDITYVTNVTVLPAAASVYFFLYVYIYIQVNIYK